MRRARAITSIAATFAAATVPAFAQTPPAATAPHVRIGVSLIESYASALYGVQQGFFTAAGLDAEPQMLAGAGAAMTLGVISGALDAAVANIGSISAAHIRGLPIYLIAPCGLYSSTAPTTVIAVLNGSPIRSARDLEGKTIGVTSMRDLQQAAAENWIEQNGGNAKAVTFLEVSGTETLAALTAARVTASVVVEPTLTQIHDKITILGKPYDSVAKSLLISGWIANKNWYDNNPLAAQRLLTAIRNTTRWSNANHHATAVILAEHAKLAPDTVDRMTRVRYGELRDVTVIQPVIDITAKYGFLPRAFPAAELFPPNLTVERS